MKLTKASALALTVCTAAFARSHAAVIVVAPTATTGGSIQITQDITFPITANGVVGNFILEEWVVSDGTYTRSDLTNLLLISYNGGAPTGRTGSLFDNLTFSPGEATPNDGHLGFVPALNVSVGDTVTLKAGLFGLPATANFNPQTTQTFNGNMWATDGGGTRLSPNVKAPEPTAFVLVGLGSLILFRRRPRAC